MVRPVCAMKIELSSIINVYKGVQIFIFLILFLKYANLVLCHVYNAWMNKIAFSASMIFFSKLLMGSVDALPRSCKQASIVSRIVLIRHITWIQ
jgi:hypothetical protein